MGAVLTKSRMVLPLHAKALEQERAHQRIHAVPMPSWVPRKAPHAEEDLEVLEEAACSPQREIWAQPLHVVAGPLYGSPRRTARKIKVTARPCRLPPGAVHIPHLHAKYEAHRSHLAIRQVGIGRGRRRCGCRRRRGPCRARNWLLRCRRWDELHLAQAVEAWATAEAAVELPIRHGSRQSLQVRFAHPGAYSHGNHKAPGTLQPPPSASAAQVDVLRRDPKVGSNELLQLCLLLLSHLHLASQPQVQLRARRAGDAAVAGEGALAEGRALDGALDAPMRTKLDNWPHLLPHALATRHGAAAHPSP
mmetsp:Transcript_112675/g.329277  ORF Transcript_112675/g.329277 Transcript_112675/m.329277 type:complete len:306 (+) Transcript_112675:1130-2047(+)